MGHPQSEWKHKKYGKLIYSGHYRRDENQEREFILMRRRKNGTYHVISMESHEMAKQIGWKHVPQIPVKQRKVKTTKKRRSARRKK